MISRRHSTCNRDRNSILGQSSPFFDVARDQSLQGGHKTPFRSLQKRVCFMTAGNKWNVLFKNAQFVAGRWEKN
ncbi:hypothetical protein CEXT_204131 [Caerostris extrusa]|uniref:Uncharacterized protein n=1 Tax=Caerostris extrusa TaxID=172846 RepID=A0AAV4PRH1_CAEEX|nr:hypothetical protein CEXT_204131 [Caerostris extrusa]